MAFVSQTTKLVTGVSSAQSQIYAHNRNSNQVELVSRDSSVGLIPGDGVSSQPVISTDESSVAFSSASANLVTIPPIAPTDIYIRVLP